MMHPTTSEPPRVVAASGPAAAQVENQSADQPKRRLSLRRNSVSLPALNVMEPPEYDPQLTPERVRHDGYDTCDTFSDGAASDEESCVTTDIESAKVPLRNLRKKSVIVPARSKVTSVNDNDLDEFSESSRANSVTSLNSISSLLKEKLTMAFPKGIKRRRPSGEYELRGVVAFLFLAIVFLCGFAHVFYHQQVLQRAYFEDFRFNKEQRHIRVFSKQSSEIALGYLGVDISEGERPYNCLPEHMRNDGSICKEWMNRARLYLNYQENGPDLRCYKISWSSLSKDYYPTDCYEEGGKYGHWYGGGRTLGMAWPVELGRVEMSPFVTGHVERHRWGSVLRRYFINSRGVAITVDPQTPLYVSINAGKESRLCLQARHDDFAYILSGLPQLNYTLCTASNMKTLHFGLSEKSLWDGLTQSDVEVINSLITEPVWQITPLDKNRLTENAVVNYTEDVIALGFLRQGHVMLNEFWQSEVGDFTLDTSRFPTIKDTINIIHRRGFRIVLTIQPFISTESSNFAEAVKKGYLVTERGGDSSRKIPALTRYNSVRSAGMIDITNNNTIPWLKSKLSKLVADYQINSFYLDLGKAYDIPHYYKFTKKLTNPDHYKGLFISAVVGSVQVFGVSGAIARPPAPIFVSLPPLPSTWESLQVMIPLILTYGIVGYSFLIPGAVGGDYLVDRPLPYRGNNSLDYSLSGMGHESESSNGLPDRELYIRWLQLATFLPVIRYAHLPSEYDEQVLELAKLLTSLRTQSVNPLLKKYVSEALDSGTPLIRPLWMLDPNDSACHLVKDEFSVGEELIVAPILSPGIYEKEVYLPAGVWKDGIDGSLRKGSRWIHNYKVSLDKVAYFVKMPDNTRF
nr:PREDICTED: uncharacterized family 31 glucosidase KIAA1161 isoform X1 [Bemisia tabaci]